MTTSLLRYNVTLTQQWRYCCAMYPLEHVDNQGILAAANIVSRVPDDLRYYGEWTDHTPTASR